MCPVSRCRRGLRRDPSGSALPTLPQSVSRGTRFSRLHWFAFATACQVARPPGRIGPSFPGPPGTFTSRLPTGRSPFPPLDMTTTATGLLCWRDSHPQEWQLASLHRIGPGFPGPPGVFTSRLPAGRSPFPPLDMTTTATGLLCWRDFHPQEWQLTSLHRIYSGSRPWTQVHARWLSNLSFEHPAQYLVLREYRQAIDDAEARLERLTQHVAEVVGSWSMAPVVEAYHSMRGVAFLTAVTFVAEIGDVRRFETPRQLMAYLGLVPSERSTGAQVWRGSITKAGNPRARRVLIEGAWTYRYPARLSRPLQVRQESLPTVVRAIAWKAQLRLCARYRRLMAAGKRQTVVTTAIAREMAAFLWAIGHAVEPRPAA